MTEENFKMKKVFFFEKYALQTSVRWDYWLGFSSSTDDWLLSSNYWKNHYASIATYSGLITV